MPVKHYTGEDLSLLLAEEEESMSAPKFFQHLLAQQKLDPDNFVIGTVDIMGELRAIILSGHTIRRGSRRLYHTSPDRLLALAMDTLSDPFIASVVCDHPVKLDGGGVAALNKDGKDGGGIIREDLGLTLCFEAGRQYVLLKGCWDDRAMHSPFHVDRRDCVLRPRPSTAVVMGSWL